MPDDGLHRNRFASGKRSLTISHVSLGHSACLQCDIGLLKSASSPVVALVDDVEFDVADLTRAERSIGGHATHSRRRLYLLRTFKNLPDTRTGHLRNHRAAAAGIGEPIGMGTGTCSDRKTVPTDDTGGVSDRPPVDFSENTTLGLLGSNPAALFAAARTWTSGIKSSCGSSLVESVFLVPRSDSVSTESNGAGQ